MPDAPATDFLAPIAEINQALQRDTFPLMGRFAEAFSQYQRDPSSPADVAFWSRALARACLVQVEGVTSKMQALVVRAHQLGLLAGPAGDGDSLAADLAAGPDDTGVAGSRLPFIRRIELTLSAFARLTKLAEPLRKSDSKFAYFKALVACRNQITHPVLLEDWHEQPRLLSSLQLGVIWFNQEALRILSGGRMTVPAGAKREREIERVMRPYLAGSPDPAFRQAAIDQFYAQVRQDLARGFEYTCALRRLLAADTSRWHDLAQLEQASPEAATWTRCYVRAFLTEVEGTCNSRFLVVRWAHEDGRLALSSQDAALVANDRRPLAQKLDVATRIFPVLFGGTAHLDGDANGRRTFEHILGRRDAFTHPTSLADLEITPDLVSTTRRVQAWFLEQLSI